MKSVLIAAALLATLTVAEYDNNNWPSYLGRCSPKDPLFNKCLVMYANKALHSILQGDKSLGIPRYDQFSSTNFCFGKGQTWTLCFDTVTVSGLEHYYVTEMNWDLEKQTIDLELKLNSAQVCSGKYKSSGTYGDRNITGKGDLDLILVGGAYGGNTTYSIKYDLIKIQGHDYVQIKESKCVCQKSLRVNFNNLFKTKEETDSDMQFINSHTDIGGNEFLKDVSKISCFIINSIFNPIFYNFPLDVILLQN